MAISLTPEQTQVVQQAIDAGMTRVADDVVGLGVEAIRQRLELQGAGDSAPTAEEWSRQLQAWMQGHAQTSPVLSDEAVSRESIYETRGL